MNDFELDEMFGSASVVAANLLPDTAQPPAHPLLKRAGISRDYFRKQMQAWVAKGEDVRSYITGCDSSIHELLYTLAREEKLL